ncbi:MAG: hypothetical protein RPS47_04520 [Colwellia sp.]|jgi:hypothetical protein
MGDRVDVSLTVRKADQKKVEEIIEEHAGSYDDLTEGACPPNMVKIIEYNFYDVNYADLKIESILQENAIPYDKEWGQGGDYNPGSEIFRINEKGEFIIKKFEGNLMGMVALSDVINAFEMNRVGEYIDRMKQEASVISWEEQEKTRFSPCNNID